jgi:16S rRNA processing protein RimM
MQVIVGRIGRPHGIRGDVVVSVRTDEPDLRFAVGARLDTDPVDIGPLRVATRRWQGTYLVVRFAGFRDRTAAEELRGVWLGVDTATLAPPEDPDEFRDHQLIGLSVRTTDGTPVGVVADVLHHGQDMLTVRRLPPASSPDSATPVPPAQAAPASAPLAQAPLAQAPLAQVSPPAPGSSEILVPFVKAIVPEVDLASGVLVIDPPPGLLNPEEAL